MAREKKQLSALGAWSMIVLFAVAIGVPSALGILKIEVTCPEMMLKRERRPISPAPKAPTSVRDIKAFPERAEAWYNDRFGLRPRMLRINGAIKLKLGMSTDPEQLVIGKDGWFFLGDGAADTISQARGLFPFSDEELKTAVGNLRARSEWLAARDIPMVFVLAPDKSEVYPEHLPDWVRKYGPTRREQLVTAMADEDIHFVDLSEVLREAKSECVTYYKTDSHWNDYGALVGYSVLMDYLTEDVMIEGVRNISDTPYELTSKHVESTPFDVFPNLLGLESRDLSDEIVRIEFAAPADPVDSFNVDGTQVSSGGNPRIPKRLEIREVRRPGAGPDALRVLVIRDSFTTAMSPYLNQSFGQIVYCPWERASGLEMTAMVERYEPDLVLFIMVQRCLGRPGAGGLGPHASWSSADGRTPADRFADARPVASGTGEQYAANIQMSFDLPAPTVTDEGLVLQVRGESSRLQFGPLAPVTDEAQILRLDVIAPVLTEAQLRLTPIADGEPIAFQAALLFPGENSIYFEVPAGGMSRPSSLLPGDKAGKYVITGWEVRQVTPQPTPDE